MQNYTKFFDFDALNCENHINCDRFCVFLWQRDITEKYSLILHSEFKLLEESQPMEKVCANKEQNGNNLCLLTPLYLFSFLTHRQVIIL